MKLFGFPLKAGMSENLPCDDGGKKFQCRYCRRHFGNAQALGGHQNLHKRERAKLAQFKYLVRLRQHDHNRFKAASNGSPSVSVGSAITSAGAPNCLQFHSAESSNGTVLLQVPDVDLNLSLACSSENLKNSNTFVADEIIN